MWHARQRTETRYLAEYRESCIGFEPRKSRDPRRARLFNKLRLLAFLRAENRQQGAGRVPPRAAHREIILQLRRKRRKMLLRDQ